MFFVCFDMFLLNHLFLGDLVFWGIKFDTRLKTVLESCIKCTKSLISKFCTETKREEIGTGGRGGGGRDDEEDV